MTMFWCIGHRGAAGYEPENTIRSVRRGIELGAQAIEVDVQAVAGEVFVIHDDRLDRTTGGSGRVVEVTPEYVRAQQAGAGERIPTLDELLEIVPAEVVLNIELKSEGVWRPALNRIRAASSPSELDSRFIISSFDHYQLVAIKAEEPKLRIAPLITGVPIGYARFAQDMGAYSVHVNVQFVRAPFIEDAHARRLRVFTFTVNHPDDVRRVHALGVDGVFSDYPDVALGAVRDLAPRAPVF